MLLPVKLGTLCGHTAMTMSRLVVLAALFVGPGAATFLLAAERPPNIVLFVADDLGYGELGCQGNPQIPTPHIDSLAKGGVRFTQAYVTAPFCSASRAGLLTGRYQTRFGHEFNAIGKQNLEPKVGLPLSEQTLADVLDAAGYATACVGKWHLGGTARFHPERRGFDEFFGFLHEGHTFAPAHFPGLVSHLRSSEPPYDADNPLLRGEQPVQEEVYLTQAITREANAFITQHQHEPFFLYVPYNAVHSPMQTTPEYFDRFRDIDSIHRRVFAAMLAAMDDSVGAILDNLRQKGLEENTLIFFLSDNGGPTEELTSSNSPLHGGKGQLFEGGVRVPFIMQWKDKLSAGRIDSRIVSSLDVFPTATAAAGRQLPEGKPVDGVDLLPYLTGKLNERPHKLLYWRFGANYALRKDNWKLVRQGRRGSTAAPVRLFDLAADESEVNDLAADRPDLIEDLKAEWNRLNDQMVEPLWGAGK